VTDGSSGRQAVVRRRPAKLIRARLLVAALLAIAAIAPAHAELFKTDKFSMYGDFRLRAEDDFDSVTAVGIERADRVRVRVRLRLGFVFDPNGHCRVEARLRSGQEESQQSPHITIIDFDGNDTGGGTFNFDRWYVRGTFGGLELWAGRNNPPIWKQDELLLDDDVTAPGLALRWRTDAGPGRLSMAGGYYTLPVGMVLYSGNLGLAQIAYEPAWEDLHLAFAGGAYLYRANPGDPDNIGLLQGNGSRDYSILAGGFQARWPAGGRQLLLGADVMHNLEDYDPADPDPITAANYDQTDGYVLQVRYGGLNRRNEWLLGYYYAHLELFAVNNSYSQDDWVRWGDLPQTRSSNMMESEFRFGWAFNPQMNLLVRLYLVDAITTVEDGNRFRIDFNYTF